MTEKTVRKFICKRCGKKAQDKQGGFSQFSQKHDTTLYYENIDLCDRCFKITTKEQKNLGFLQEAITQGLIKQDDLATLKKFQLDKNYRRQILEAIGAIKRDPAKLEIKVKHLSPSDLRRKEKRKGLKKVE